MSDRNRFVEVEIEGTAFRGFGVGRSEGRVIFVRGAVPGDRALVRVTKRRKRHAEGVIEELQVSSTLRTRPRCRYFGECGGCSWQNLAYSQQLRSKQEQVADIFERIGQITAPDVCPTLACETPYLYRNKMEFSFGNRRWLTRQEVESKETIRKDFALGLHRSGRFDKILDLEECHLQQSPSHEIVNFVRLVAKERGWSAYDSRENSGYLRNLVIRLGVFGGDFLLYLVTSSWNPSRMEELAGLLQDEFPSVKTLLNGVNPGRSPVASGEEDHVLYGEGVIEDRIGGLAFSLGPHEFFQPNTRQAELLYQTVQDQADLTGQEVVFDLYCGIGAISLFLAQNCREVVGIDHSETAIARARDNASRNGISNCNFHAMDVRQAFNSSFRPDLRGPDLAVLDPPRAGLHPKVVTSLLEMAPKMLVYISCNPTTQARDLQLLKSRYQIQVIQPVDMFPQTYHIENVVSLRCRS